MKASTAWFVSDLVGNPEERFSCNASHLWLCISVFCSPGKEHILRTDGEECVECPVAKYKNTSGNTACLNCPPGVTNNETGQTSCDICKYIKQIYLAILDIFS